MWRIITLIGLHAWTGLAMAGHPAPVSTPADAAIERGLAFLVKDAQAWKSQYKCASCHHAGLVLWSMREAKERGRPVDEAFLAELTKWIADSGDGKTSIPRPPGFPKAHNTRALNFAVALASDPRSDAAAQAGLKRLLKTVEADQTDNGSWTAWPLTRPPIFGKSDETATAFATLALLPAAAGGDRTATSVRNKAIGWLVATKSDDDPQSIAVRLVLWRKLNRPANEWQPLVERIKKRQNADGGWSQTKEMASDAWATGQALYALAHGGLNADDPAIAQGQAFLVKTQRRDGSWPMTSRPIKPGGKGSNSLVPITCAGTAWAVMGLVRSTPQRRSTEERAAAPGGAAKS